MKSLLFFAMMVLGWCVQAEMHAIKDCTLETKNNVHYIRITGFFPRLCEYDLQLQTSEYKALRIVYTAVDLPKEFNATLYYLPKGIKNFTKEYRIPLNNLVSDGKKHEKLIFLPEKWYKNSIVTAFRFDPVNKSPCGEGKYIIHMLEWVNEQDAERICENMNSNLDNWGKPMRVSLNKKDEMIMLSIQGKNSRIYNESVKIKTKDSSALIISYRAKDLPAGVSGNLFFRHAGDKGYREQNRARIRGMIADGKWHDLKINLPGSWKAQSSVIALRLDLADQAETGTIEIKSIRFIIHTAGQKPDPAWKDVRPELPAETKNSLPGVYWQARMIFSPEDKGERTIPYAMRKKFPVPADLSSAMLQITADDCFAVWINGKKVLDRLSEHIWWEPVATDVTAFLQRGKENLICVKYINYSGPGGVLFQLGMKTRGNQLINICSDQNVTVAQCPSGNKWLMADFPEKNWTKVTVGGTPPMPPWKRELPFRDVSRTLSSKLLSFHAPEIAVAGQPFKISIQVKTADPIPAQKISVKLFTLPNLIALPEKTVDIPAYKAGENTLVFNMPIPRYFSDCKMRYIITSDCLNFDKPIQGDIIYRSTPIPGKRIQFAVKKTANGARLFANETPMHMLCGNVHVTDCRYASKLEQVPVNFRTCYLKMNAPHKMWIRSLKGDYDFTVIDRCAETRLEIDPNVYLIFSVELGLPLKFAKDFTHDIVRREDGSTYKSSILSVQPGSPLNKKVIQDALVALVKYCEKAPYANRIAGFLLADGETMEQQYFGSSRAFLYNSLIDYSIGAREHYKKVTGQTIPSTAERLNPKAGIFYDVHTQQPLIRASEYLSEIMSGNLIDYCRIMKKTMTIPKLCGAYYGYHFEYAGGNWRRQIAGHNRLREVLDSGVVDFLVSPPSYSVRNLGDSGADMKPFTSISQAGVLPVIDDDTRTHTINYNGFFQTLTREQTNSIMRRNLGQYLCRQECVWMLPLNEGREFDDPQTINDLAIFKNAAAYQIDKNIRRNCEIAVVVDERTYDFLAPDKESYRHESFQSYNKDGKVVQRLRHQNRLFGQLICHQRDRLAKLGAPIDYLLSSDVAKNINRYKLWIFLDVFQYDDAFLKAIRQLQSKPVTLVWFYAPGYICNRTMNTSNMERLTGFRFTQLPAGSLEMELFRRNTSSLLLGYPENISPRFAVSDESAVIRGRYNDADASAIAQKKVGRSDSWFFGGNFISSGIWRDLARQAGVHIYSDNDDTLFANDAFVAFHAERPGKKTITLPGKVSAVWDLFSCQKIADECSRFSFDAELHESRIFFLGDLPSAIKREK